MGNGDPGMPLSPPSLFWSYKREITQYNETQPINSVFSTSYKKNSWLYLQHSQNRKSAQAIVPPCFSNANRPKGKGKLGTLCRRAQTRITFRGSQVQVTGLVIANYPKHFLLNLKQIFWIVIRPRRHFWASSNICSTVISRPAECDTRFRHVGESLLENRKLCPIYRALRKKLFCAVPLIRYPNYGSCYIP